MPLCCTKSDFARADSRSDPCIHRTLAAALSASAATAFAYNKGAFRRYCTTKRHANATREKMVDQRKRRCSAGYGQGVTVLTRQLRKYVELWQELPTREMKPPHKVSSFFTSRALGRPPYAFPAGASGIRNTSVSAYRNHPSVSFCSGSSAVFENPTGEVMANDICGSVRKKQGPPEPAATGLEILARPREVLSRGQPTDGTASLGCIDPRRRNDRRYPFRTLARKPKPSSHWGFAWTQGINQAT